MEAHYYLPLFLTDAIVCKSPAKVKQLIKIFMNRFSVMWLGSQTMVTCISKCDNLFNAVEWFLSFVLFGTGNQTQNLELASQVLMLLYHWPYDGMF